MTTPAPAPNDLPSLFAKLRNGIVEIGVLKTPSSPAQDVLGWVGTGFLVDAKCTFVTAKHVVEGYEDRLIIKYHLPGQAGKFGGTKARLLHAKEGWDLAFLRFINDDCRVTLPPLTIRASRTLAELAAEPVLIIGHPQLQRERIDFPIARSGIVASVDLSWQPTSQTPRTPTILLDLTAIGGLSGSPVILQRTGEVIGVIKASVKDPQLDPEADSLSPSLTPTNQSGFSFATPLNASDYIEAITKGREAPANTP